MKVRTFHVKSMHEAIRSIKDTLGPDAVILSTKRVRSWDNGFGLLGGSVLEVMAAIEDDAAVPEAAPLLGEDEQTRAAVSFAGDSRDIGVHTPQWGEPGRNVPVFPARL